MFASMLQHLRASNTLLGELLLLRCLAASAVDKTIDGLPEKKTPGDKQI
jgi:hypothetical protein